MLPALLVLTLALPAPSHHDPNVLVLVADDLNNEFIGVYGEGPDRRQPPTPVLDALAAEGVRFNNAYSNPICSPTRATILTGRYCWRTGIGWPLDKGDPVFLDPAETTLPEAMPRQYSSYLLGKWHLGAGWGNFDPLVHGFTARAGRGAGDYHDYFRQVVVPWWWYRERGTEYLTTDTTNDAIRLIQAISEPWLLVVAYNAPHSPFHVPPDHLHSYDDPTTNVEMYGAMVEALDTEIGRLLAEVNRKRTTIVFLGDNGSPRDVVFWDRRGKSTLYEGGVNVPLIVAGAGVPEKSRGRVTDALVNTTDLYETILELAGKAADVTPDSISFVPVLRDPDRGLRDWVYCERFEPDGSWTKRCARDDRYKLIVDFQLGEEEFYDLSVAPPGDDGFEIHLRNEEQQRHYESLRSIIDHPER